MQVLRRHRRFLETLGRKSGTNWLCGVTWKRFAGKEEGCGWHETLKLSMLEQWYEPPKASQVFCHVWTPKVIVAYSLLVNWWEYYERHNPHCSMCWISTPWPICCLSKSRWRASSFIQSLWQRMPWTNLVMAYGFHNPNTNPSLYWYILCDIAILGTTYSLFYDRVLALMVDIFLGRRLFLRCLQLLWLPCCLHG